MTATRAIAASAMPEAKLESLLAQYTPALARVAATYERDAMTRKDLLQEIAIALWRAWPSFRGECSERTFVLRIAHNRGISHALRRNSAHVPLDEADDVSDPNEDPQQHASHAQTIDRLIAALHTLPLPQREVMSLALEGLRYAEIGEVLGISVENVAVRVHRARDRLRKIMGASQEETKP